MKNKEEVIELLVKTKKSLNNARIEIKQLTNLLGESFVVNSKCIEKDTLDEMRNKLNFQKKTLDKQISKLINE